MDAPVKPRPAMPSWSVRRTIWTADRTMGRVEAMTTQDVADWWGTAVSRVEPNRIELRGIPVQDLIGTVGFGSMIWLMLRGEQPTPGQGRLLEAALVAGVDHGPHAPSIAVAR